MNVGSGHEIAICDLAEQVAATVGYSGSIKWDTSKPNGQPFRRLDVSRAQEALYFEVSIDFGTGLAETVAWYERYRAR